MNGNMTRDREEMKEMEKVGTWIVGIERIIYKIGAKETSEMFRSQGRCSEAIWKILIIIS